MVTWIVNSNLIVSLSIMRLMAAVKICYLLGLVLRIQQSLAAVETSFLADSRKYLVRVVIWLLESSERELARQLK